MKRSLWLVMALSLIVGLAACSATKGKITGHDADPAAVPDLAGEYAVNGTDGRAANMAAGCRSGPATRPDTTGCSGSSTKASRRGPARWRGTS